MQKHKYAILFFVLSLATACLAINEAFAKTDLSLTEADISFSKEEPLEGDLIRIFARVKNLGDTDVYGYVIFLDNEKEIAGPQPISVKAKTYDDAFVDWKVVPGNHNIKIKILDISLPDEDLNNNKTFAKQYFVDIDTDKDKIGNEKDEDDDNDGLTDKQESAMGTNPKELDTDNDGIKDNADAFPKDKIEWQDADQDGLGDNKDLDDDNDGIFDFEETYEFGTNPKNPDTDSDGLNDKQEIEQKTDPKRSAAMADEIINNFFPSDSIYLILGAPIVLFALLFLFRRKKRRR